MSASPDCIDADLAAGYAEHRLAPDEVAAVEAHIDTCAACRELVSMLARLQYTQPASPASDQEARAIGGVLPRGARIGPFEIDEPLDAGGMGLVYRAHDTRLDRRVAMKAVRDLRGDPAQLMQEARMMAQLAHPNVVPVHDVIEAHDQIFLAMELVVGRNVRQWIDDAPRRWTAIVDVFLAAGAGLAAAHAAGIVHGDVKPANILVGDDGRVRITDFGLASAGATATAAAPTTAVRGTPAYMAPEQRAGVPCDAAGDQYALCASIHEALFGASPGRPPTKSPRVPRALRRCLARGLAPLPADRYPAVTALLRDLRATRSARRRWLIAGTVAALGIGVVAFGYGEHRVEHALCADAAPRLASPWTEVARADVRRAFTSTHKPYAADTLGRVEANLDHWSGDLDAARAGVCEAGWFERSAPREQLTAKLDCLAQRVTEGRALVSQLSEADAATVSHAVAATDGLSPIARCDESAPVRTLLPDSADLQHEHELFGRAHALVDSGKAKDAIPIAQASVDAAVALGDPGTEADARVELASAQAQTTKYDDAEKNLRLALPLAERAQDDRVRAQVWVNLVQIEFWRGHYAQVDFLTPAALGAAERTNDLFSQSEILLMAGGAISQLDRVPEAQAMFERAVTMRRALYRVHDRRLSAALSALGNAYAMQGQLDAGIAAHKEAVTIAEGALGPSHPSLATLRGNLASDYMWALREPEAVAELEQCVAILTATDGDKGQKVAVALTDLGTAQLLAGQLDKAVASSTRAEALWAEIGKDHPDRGDALLVRYQATVALGKPAEVADLEAAVKLTATMPPFMRAREQLALGQASTGAHAIELVTAAATGFASSTLPLAQRELGVARAWLAEHPP